VCLDDLDNCLSDTTCNAFFMCLTACPHVGYAACASGCETANPGYAAPLAGWQACLCQQCQVHCTDFASVFCQ
jgi:hypothetical protein